MICYVIWTGKHPKLYINNAILATWTSKYKKWLK